MRANSLCAGPHCQLWGAAPSSQDGDCAPQFSLRGGPADSIVGSQSESDMRGR